VTAPQQATTAASLPPGLLLCCVQSRPDVAYPRTPADPIATADAPRGGRARLSSPQPSALPCRPRLYCHHGNSGRDMQAQAVRASSRAGANPTWGEWEAYAGDVLAEADEAHGD